MLSSPNKGRKLFSYAVLFALAYLDFLHIARGRNHSFVLLSYTEQTIIMVFSVSVAESESPPLLTRRPRLLLGAAQQHCLAY